MRVTNKMVHNNFLLNLNRNTVRMEKTMQQLSSGQAISRPSDDPSSLSQLMTLQRSLNQAAQYGRNIDTAEGWLNVSDTAYSQVNDILHRVRDLATMGATDTWSTTDRAGMSGELDQLIQELVQVANTSYDGKYIFATYDLTKKPFDFDGTGNVGMVDLNGNITTTGPTTPVTRDVEIAPNVPLDIKNNSEAIFMANNFFDKLQTLSQDIKDGNLTNVSNSITDVNNFLEDFMHERVKVGVKSSRLDTARARFEEEKMNLNTMISKIGDTDMAEAMMNYKMQESVYQAALGSGAKIMQISLLDYLR